MHAGSDEVLPAKIVQDLQGLGYDADGSKVAASDANMDLLDNKAKKTLATKGWRSLKARPAAKAKVCPHCGKEAGSRYCCMCASISLIIAAPALQVNTKNKKQDEVLAPATGNAKATARAPLVKSPPPKAAGKK